MRFKLIFWGVSTALLVSCKNPLWDSSSADARFSPGWKQDAPGSLTWNFTSGHQNEYTFSASEIKLNNSGASLSPINIDQDNSSLGFGGGTGNNIAWNTGYLELNATGKTAGLGNFISRFFTTTSTINWTKLSIATPFPLGRPYPNNRHIETDYAPYNLDMTGNVLLLHMDEATWNGTAGEVADSSGSGNSGRSINGSTPLSAGRFNRAASFSNGQYVLINNSSSLDITSAITLEAWVYPTVADGALHAIISKRNGYQTDSAFALFILSNNIYMDLGNSRFSTSSITWQAQRWHHVVATYDPANGHEWKIYLNNVLEEQTTGSPNSYVSTTSPLHIGAHVGDSNAFQGRIDEVAIYNRALSASEVSARYHRGALRLELQARSCQIQSDCLAQPFLGPDGTSNTSYSEYQSSYATPLNEFNLNGFSGQNFQYQIAMSTEAGSTLSPQLQSVTVSPAIFPLTSSEISSVNGFEYKILTDFTATFTGTVKFQLGKDGQWYFWNGTAWTTTLSASDSNTANEVKQNIQFFPDAAGKGLLKVKAFLSSNNGVEMSTLSTITVNGTN